MMVKSCWICKTAGNKLNKSYFRIPKILFHRNPDISELSAVRMKKWRDILLLPDNTSGIRICSDHFLSGNPARLLDVNDPDWIPTKNLKQKIGEKENMKLSVIDPETDQMSCRLCLKFVRSELCVNIFQNENKKIVRTISIILGHKITCEKDISSYVCNSCLKKVRVCARLLTYFRRNEKRYRDSVKNRGMETGEEKIQGTDKVGHVVDERMIHHLKVDTMENNFAYEDATRISGSYDSEQIRSILEDNSMSSEEGLTEGRTSIQCKRRKYSAQSVNVRPVEVKTLKCNNCYRKFDDLDDLKDHKNFCKLFYCQLCKPQMIFTEREEQEKHKKKYHCQSLVCHICGKNYSQSYLVKHFKNHFEERKKCPFCSKTLKNITIFMTHLDNAHGNRFSTVCDACGGSFKNLKKHLVSCGKS